MTEFSFSKYLFNKVVLVARLNLSYLMTLLLSLALGIFPKQCT